MMKIPICGNNPRFDAYAKEHSKTPEEMLEMDREKYPGGCMTGYIIWMSEKRQEFYKVNPGAFIDRYNMVDHKAFDKFLGIGV